MVSVPSGITASPPLTAKQARKGHANTPNPTPRPIARPFLFLPSREMLPPIKFTNVPSVARVEIKATFRTPALPQPRHFVPVTCVCTGVPALTMILSPTLTSLATTTLATLLLLFTSSAKRRVTIEPLLRVVCAKLLMNDGSKQASNNSFFMIFSLNSCLAQLQIVNT